MANTLDKLGLKKEADKLDYLIRKVSSDSDSDFSSSYKPELMWNDSDNENSKLELAAHKIYLLSESLLEKINLAQSSHSMLAKTSVRALRDIEDALNRALTYIIRQDYDRAFRQISLLKNDSNLSKNSHLLSDSFIQNFTSELSEVEGLLEDVLNSTGGDEIPHLTNDLALRYSKHAFSTSALAGAEEDEEEDEEEDFADDDMALEEFVEPVRKRRLGPTNLTRPSEVERMNRIREEEANNERKIADRNRMIERDQRNRMTERDRKMEEDSFNDYMSQDINT